MLIENGRMSERQIAPVVQAREKGKVVSAREAVRLIRSGDTIATGGFVGIGFAEEIAVALEELSLAAEDELLANIDKPRNLTLVYAAGQGDGQNRGLNHLAQLATSRTPTPRWWRRSSSATTSA
jgi:propionate CoA-transferase